MEEIWKEIIGYDGDYLISNKGNVKSTKYKEDRIMSLHKNPKGYLTVCLFMPHKKPIRFYVHRLVGLYFLEKDNPDKNTINHIDGIKINNLPENLEWCTRKENSIHAWNLGLCENVRSAIKKVSKNKRPKEIQYTAVLNSVTGIFYQGQKEAWEHSGKKYSYNYFRRMLQGGKGYKNNTMFIKTY